MKTATSHRVDKADGKLYLSYEDENGRHIMREVDRGSMRALHARLGEVLDIKVPCRHGSMGYCVECPGAWSVGR